MAGEWTSRRRVEVTLAHQEPDRVPLNLTITRAPYLRLRSYLGLPPEEDSPADRFGEVRPGLDVIAALGIDIISLKLHPPAGQPPPLPRPDGTLPDEWGVGYRRITLPDGNSLNEVAYCPLQQLKPSEINLDDYPWPDPGNSGRVQGLAEEARRLYEETDLALLGRFGGTILELAAFLRGYEQWLIDLVLHPDFAVALLNRIADIQIAMDEAGIRAAGRYLSIFKVSGEDLGMQDRPLFSMKMWQELLRPVLRRRWQAARAALDHYAPHVKMMLHSDGAIRPFIPDLIDDGIDILDPIQVHCTGMELTALKHDFGERLAFHGAVDTQYVLPFGDEAAVEAEVGRCISSLGPGGGFILAPVHNVQPDVCPGNIVAMCHAAQRYGQYPLKGVD